MMDVPDLKSHQFAVGKAEYATGHVLRKDGTLFRTGGDLADLYETFESYEEALSFVKKQLEEDPKYRMLDN